MRRPLPSTAGTALSMLATAMLLFVSNAGAQEEKTKVVEDGRKVSIEYTLKLDDGTTADSNVGGEPLVYEQGSPQVLPALQAALAEMAIDETRKVTLTPEQAYGPIDSALYHEVDAELIPEEARSVGAELVSVDEAGNQRLVRVRELRGEQILLDLNHPLAGRTLHFDVKVVGVE